MVEVKKEGETFIFEVLGTHKLWSLKSRLDIPAEDILDAYQNPEELKGWKGWRIPGTHIPGLITAGTFHLDGKMVFWDVMDKSKSIIVKLKDQQYEKLVIEVEDPAASIALLKGQ